MMMSSPSDAPRRPTLQKIGRYRVVERRGKGSMGVVYAARDEVMGRDVAVKVIMADLESDPDMRNRFVREAKTAARLSHPNILTIFDIGEEDERLYIVMELLDGPTLEKLLKEQVLSFEQKLEIVGQVCNGLAAAGEAGVCHRDIKPNNLAVQSDGTVKILDFGIARVQSSTMTATGFIVGTADYMSPEQARGLTVDERSDIFSVGAVLYLMLTGRKPFAGPDIPAILHKVVSEEPLPIAPDEAPPILARIVAKALAKNLAQRYQNFKEFGADVLRFRRLYEAETSQLAGAVAGRIRRLQALIDEEHVLAPTLELSASSFRSQIDEDLGRFDEGLQGKGVEGLTTTRLKRTSIIAIDEYATHLRSTLEPKVVALRAAVAEVRAGEATLDADPTAALAHFEAAARHSPSPRVGRHIERCRAAIRERQELEQQVATLIAEATESRKGGRSNEALMLVADALKLLPMSAAALDLQRSLRQDLARERAHRRRDTEVLLERARHALAAGRLSDADAALDDARQLEADAPGLAAVAARISAVRTARGDAQAEIDDIADGVIAARRAVAEGRAPDAASIVDGLAARYPDVEPLQKERARLTAASHQLNAAHDARERVAAAASMAEEAWNADDWESAGRHAATALEMDPSHEPSIRIHFRARARAREIAERHARVQRASESAQRAQAALDEGRLDRAVSEARAACDLDAENVQALAVLSRALKQQLAEAAAAAGGEDTAARQRTARELAADAQRALSAGEFERARALGQVALVSDPLNTDARNVIVSAATAIATKDDTVEMLTPYPFAPEPVTHVGTATDQSASDTPVLSRPSSKALRQWIASLGKRQTPTPTPNSTPRRP